MHLSLKGSMDRQPLTDRLGDRLLAEYGGAAAAYSLRALNGNGDNVVRVRRASDNDEKDFTAEQVSSGEMVNWVTEGSATADGFVETWYDQSGNGRDATQSVAASQPKIVASGTLEVDENGNPDINWSSGDFFDLTSEPLYTGSLSLFSVFTYGSSNERLMDNRGTGATGTIQGWQIKTYQTGSADIVIFDEGNDSYLQKTSEVARSGVELLSVITNGTTLSTYRKGVEFGTNASNGTLPIDFSNANAVRIGSNLNGNNTQQFTGRMGAIVLYNMYQSANRAAIEAKLAELYGITLA